MKTKEEILKYNYGVFPEEGDTRAVLSAMEEYGKLMYNQAIDDAADNALADYTKVHHHVLGEDIEVYVIKNSILKLKK